jgi:hypothetical protein
MIGRNQMANSTLKTTRFTATYMDRALLRSTLKQYTKEIEDGIAHCEDCEELEGMCAYHQAIAEQRKEDYAALTLGMLQMKAR